MSKKLLVCLCFIPFVFANGPSALAEERGHSCPDMRQHEQVLNEGMKLHDQSKTIKRPISPPLFGYPEERRGGMWQSRRDDTPAQREIDRISQRQWFAQRAELMKLESHIQRLEAVRQAEQFEEFGAYAPACKLYERIIVALIKAPFADLSEMDSLKQSLERSRLCQSAEVFLGKKQYSEAIDALDKAAHDLSKSDHELICKSYILKPITDNLYQAVKLQEQEAELTSEKKARASAAVSYVLETGNTWRRQLECLGMAQKLDHTAFNLEKDGQYAMAEKLYRQALSIKHKNLGRDDVESIKQNADLARVAAAQGRKAEACKYYEDALRELKKIPKTERTCASMLESYGDMLEQMNYKDKARKIYDEARTANQKLAGASP